MDEDSQEYRKLYSIKYNVEREVRQDWYQKLKKTGQEVPHVMGKSALQTSKEFIEDYDRRYQIEVEARRNARERPLNIAQLQAEEEKKEREYRRQEQARYDRRQAGLVGEAAHAIVPSVVNENANNSGNSSGGAVSGTDSESEPDT